MPNTILLVEDNAIIALAEAGMIERHGFSVTRALSGETVLELVGTDPSISLILMDIDLGRGFDGTETARKILSIRELPIIFLTSHAEKEYVDLVDEISGYGYILKNSGKLVIIQSIRMAYKLFSAHLGLKESEEKYRAAFMTSSDAVNINRMDGLYVDINEGFTALTGYFRDELIEKSSTFLFDPDEMRAQPLEFERVLAGETVQRERTILSKNNLSLPVLMNSKKVEEECLQAIFHDLTRVKKAEESLRE